MLHIILGTKNPHKQEKLRGIVSGHFAAVDDPSLPDVEEHGATFEEIARNKAAEYSLLKGGFAIATDGGAVFPGLSAEEWNPLFTKRFAADDRQRVSRLLEMLRGRDRTVQWHEAIAVAKDGKVLFSASARAMDGVIDETFDESKYKEGIWLCSITSFPQLGGRNYFDLTEDERSNTEDSWAMLDTAFREWAKVNVK